MRISDWSSDVCSSDLLVPTQDRAAVGAMLRAQGLIDIIIPRGGKGLVARVQDEARVPVLAHLDGINHLYIDDAAAPDPAVALAVNAKMRRTGLCGATEPILIARAYAAPRTIVDAQIGRASSRDSTSTAGHIPGAGVSLKK